MLTTYIADNSARSAGVRGWVLGGVQGDQGWLGVTVLRWRTLNLRILADWVTGYPAAARRQRRDSRSTPAWSHCTAEL